MNELDRREDPQNDEYLPGCAMVDSCSNILTGDQFYNFLNHNFDRHYEQNRAPLGLYFHAAWLKNNPEFLDAFLFWIDPDEPQRRLLRHDDPGDPVGPEPPHGHGIEELRALEREVCRGGAASLLGTAHLQADLEGGSRRDHQPADLCPLP